MAYFANGSEGDFYEAAICARCAHYPDPYVALCPIWELHQTHNYEQHGDATLKSVLDALIPRVGTQNHLCSMFVPAKPEWANHGAEYEAWLAGESQVPA